MFWIVYDDGFILGKILLTFNINRIFSHTYFVKYEMIEIKTYPFSKIHLFGKPQKTGQIDYSIVYLNKLREIFSN